MHLLQRLKLKGIEIAWLCMWASFLLAPVQALNSILFYGGLVGGSILLVRHYTKLPRSVLMLWAVSFLFLAIGFMLSLPTEALSKLLRYVVITWLFIGVSCYAWWRPGKPFLRAVVAVAAMSMLLVLSHYFYVGFERKMRIWPMQDMLNTMMLVYAVVGLLSLHMFATQKKAPKWFVAVTALSFVLLACAQARGAMLAFLSGVILILFLYATVRVRYGVVAALALIAAAVYVEQDVLEKIIVRGDAHRFDIWQQVWSWVVQRPLGYGFENEQVMTNGKKIFAHPHNIFLALLFYTGFLGSLLFSAFIWLRVRLQPVKVYMPFLLFWVIGHFFEGGRFIDGTGSYLFAFWLPLLLPHIQEDIHE